MNTGAKVAVGAGVLGAIYLLFLRPEPPAAKQQATVGRASELLAFFNRNGGLDLNGQNQEQNARIRAFQTAYNLSNTGGSIRLREDGVWDGATLESFKRLTGYTPPGKQIPATSGWG